jgi:hypothetical protein
VAHALVDPRPVGAPANRDGGDLDPGTEKYGGALLILAGATILMAIVIGEALFPAAYSRAYRSRPVAIAVPLLWVGIFPG